jgi:hypothetical protein
MWLETLDKPTIRLDEQTVQDVPNRRLTQNTCFVFGQNIIARPYGCDKLSKFIITIPEVRLLQLAGFRLSHVANTQKVGTQSHLH